MNEVSSFLAFVVAMPSDHISLWWQGICCHKDASIAITLLIIVISVLILLSSRSYLNSLCKEEVLGEVAAEGLEAALVVQQLLPHQGGHPRGAVDPKQIAGCGNNW